MNVFLLLRKIIGFKEIIGYMNFKVSVMIEENSHKFRIVVRITKDGKFYYDHAVKVKK